MLLGHPIDLKAKAGGEKSMSEKRGSLEDAEGVVPQDPLIPIWKTEPFLIGKAEPLEVDG
jgi:hypothetical protein